MGHRPSGGPRRRADRLFLQLGDRWGRLRATTTLADLAEISGGYERAVALHRDGLRMAEELGLWDEASFRLSGQGRIALLTGDLAEADELHERARALAAQRSHQGPRRPATRNAPPSCWAPRRPCAPPSVRRCRPRSATTWTGSPRGPGRGWAPTRSPHTSPAGHAAIQPISCPRRPGDGAQDGG